MEKIHWKIIKKELLSLETLDIDSLISSGRLIKSSPARTVVEISIQGKEFFLKIFFTPTIFDRIRSLFAPSKAMLEWKAANRLKEYGIPTVIPEAVGEIRHGSHLESYLLVPKIQNVCSLMDFTINKKDDIPLELRRKITRGLGELTAKLHQSGILHRDFHSGNWLVGENGELYLIDLHTIRFYRNLSRQARLLNIASFANFFIRNSTKSDRLRFLSAYLSYFPDSKENLRTLAQEMDKYISYFLRDFFYKRDKRCLKNNRHFIALSSAHGKGIRSQKDDKTIDLFKNPDVYILSGEILKNSPSSTVVKTPLGVLKRFNRKKTRNLIIDCFRQSRARKAWVSGYRLLSRGIPTPRPIGFMDKRAGPFLISSYILMEEAKGKGVDRFLEEKRECITQGEFFRLKHRILEKLAKILRKLHASKLYHRDLKAANFMVYEENRDLVINLIDLDVLKYDPFRPKIKQVNDLRRLLWALSKIKGITKSDLLRFFKYYSPFSKKDELVNWWKDATDFSKYGQG